MRIYYTEPARLEFTSTVTAVEPQQDGRWHVFLADTAFYPTTGGQPFDTGRLDGANVVDVFEREDGEVVHVVDRALSVGQEVAGVIDRARRLDHMEQHSGQHVLSAAFVRRCGVATVSFHLGSTDSTIDLAREVTAAEIQAAEEAANEVVREDRRVAIRFVSSEEAATLPLRKEPVRGGELRLIEIADWDLSACGGTHVARTGQIGAIAVTGWERYKGASRVHFVCGGRAVRAFRSMRDAVSAATRVLSVQPEELPAAIERMQDEARDLRRRARALEAQLSGYRAAELMARAVPVGNMRAVLEAFDDLDASGLKTLATAITGSPGLIAVLLGGSGPHLLVTARSADVELDVSKLLKDLVGRFGGKGGGKPDLAQGGGLVGSPADILAFVRDRLAAGQQ